MTTPDLEAFAKTSPLGLGAYLGSLPGAKPFIPARHLVQLNAEIMEAINGECRRLLVSMPPQHGKSNLTSVLTPAWFLGTWPNRSVLLASYAAKLAKHLGRKARLVLEKTGRSTYEVGVSTDAAAAGEWRLDGFEGGMVSAGIAGDFRGRPGDLVIVDDPIKDSKQAMSPGYLDGLWDWFTSVLEGRLAQDGTLIVCATRLDERDLTGRILDAFGDEWRELRLPAIAEEEDPLGREPGEALWPERYSAEYLAKRRKIVGPYWWNAEYQQRPTPASGVIINPAWFQYFDRMPERFDEVLTSWDTNLKATKAGSFAAGQVWGRIGADRYLLARVRGRWGFERFLVEFERVVNRWKAARRHLVEDTAIGPAAMDVLRRKFTGILAIPVAGKGSKVARLHAVAPTFESANVFVPRPGSAMEAQGGEAGWVRSYVGGLAAFPNGPDGTDEGDCTSQALAFFERGHETRVASSVPPATGRPSTPRKSIGRVNLWDGPGPSTGGGGRGGSFGRVR